MCLKRRDKSRLLMRHRNTAAAHCSFKIRGQMLQQMNEIGGWAVHRLSSSSFLACNSGLRSTICRHHPPQMAVLSKICCFGECKVVLFQILLDSAEPRDAGTTWFSSPVCRRGSFCFLSMRIICPNRVSRCDWITAVSLGCFVSLHTSLFRTNWYHLMPSSICRHHWSSAPILHASILDIAQQSEPYKNIGKMHVLYSFWNRFIQGGPIKTVPFVFRCSIRTG